MAERAPRTHSIYRGRRVQARESDSSPRPKQTLVALSFRNAKSPTLCGVLGGAEDHFFRIGQPGWFYANVEEAFERYEEKRDSYEDARPVIVDDRLLAATIGVPMSFTEVDDPFKNLIGEWVKVAYLASSRVVAGKVVGREYPRLVLNPGVLTTTAEFNRKLLLDGKTQLSAFYNESIIHLL